MGIIYIDKDTLLRVNIYAPYKGRSKLDTQEIRDAVGVVEITEPPTPAGYSEDTYYRTEQDMAPYVIYTKKSDEQLAQLAQVKAKQQRSNAVSAITVTTSAGNVFDGDEESQGRMARAVIAMDDGDTAVWILADNAVTTVGRAELREALRLAGIAQTELWSAPYG